MEKKSINRVKIRRESEGMRVFLKLVGGGGVETNDDRIIGALARTRGHMSRSSRGNSTPLFSIYDIRWKLAR